MRRTSTPRLRLTKPVSGPSSATAVISGVRVSVPGTVTDGAAVSVAPAGALGELLHARQTGLLPNLRSEIQRLRTEARFFVDAEIERFILSQVGE